ncbi:MAG TPA: hypothetical protein VKF80_03975 [Candidatus Eisenbacteria bacterium]|nr:hypothetical protein [Candidatus Eisenbacteria bacterium]
MKDIGVRLARQRLLRYRVPTPEGARWRRWVMLGVAAWGLWAIFLSDHSVLKLLKLKTDRDHLANQYAEAQIAYSDAKDRVPDEKELTDEQAERILRERHNYARPGEIVYYIGTDTMRAQTP